MRRLGFFILGLIAGAAILAPAGAYLFVRFGGLPMATSGKPFPFEKTFAHAALHASIGSASNTPDPLPLTDANLLAGAQVYRQNCDMCHGLPAHPKPAIAKGEYPPPPQLFEPKEMVTDDPQGTTYWKVSNGIRLTGMPGFSDTLSSTERWQVSMLLTNADKLPPTVKAALTENGQPQP